MRTDIKNPWIRRPLLVFTVAAIVVCLGPLHLIQATLRWVEWEFEVNLRAVWRGPK